MVFPVVGGDGKPTGYDIDNSVRMGDGRRLSKTFTEVTAERKKHTISGWVKKCETGSEEHLILAYGDSNNYAYLRFHSDETLKFHIFGGGDVDANIITNRLFRDPSAWYHVVLVYDSAQGTDSNRVKIYINGVQETSFSTSSYPTQNFESSIGDNVAHYICDSSDGDFYLSEWYYIGNQALSPSDFGETNDNGVWVPKKYEGSFGSTNDTFLEFKQTGTGTDSSGIGADTSGEDNHMASTSLAATDVTTDTPTNNFCTFNPLDNDTDTGAASFSEGNLVIHGEGDAQSGCPSTMAVSNGAWYIEGKCLSSTFEIGMFGYGDGFSFNLANHPPTGDNGYPFAYNYGGNLTINNSDSQTSVGTFTTNDILAIALDMDNNTIKFYKNGSQVGTTITDTNLNTYAPYTFYVANHTGDNDNNMFSLNTGNPSHAISSGNADANGYGNFEYAVPSGFYSLCTKNLAEYG